MQGIFTKALARGSPYWVISLGLLSLLATSDPAQAQILTHSQKSNPAPYASQFPEGVIAELMPNQMPEQIPEQMPQKMSDTAFRQIEQSAGVKLAVTATASTLIGLELWWFLGKSRRKSASYPEL